MWFVQLPNMFEVNVSGFCLGLVGGAVLIACNLALEKWGWASDKDAQAYTEKMVLQRYGRVRRVSTRSMQGVRNSGKKIFPSIN